MQGPEAKAAVVKSITSKLACVKEQEIVANILVPPRLTKN